MIGTLLHYGFDALLLSCCLAGIKRSTGLTPALKKIGSKEIQGFLASYLEIGEWCMDLIIVFCGRSGYFKRER